MERGSKYFQRPAILGIDKPANGAVSYLEILDTIS